MRLVKVKVGLRVFWFFVLEVLMVRLLDSAVVQSEIRGKFYFCEATSLGYHLVSVVEVPSSLNALNFEALFSCISPRYPFILRIMTCDFFYRFNEDYCC